MTKKELIAKIGCLLHSNEGENVYIGFCLLVSQLAMTKEEALMTISPQFIYSKDGNFSATYRIGTIQLEYSYEKAYVPYMGEDSTLVRMLAVKKAEELDYQLDYATFLEYETQKNPNAIEQAIISDYRSLIPDILQLLSS